MRLALKAVPPAVLGCAAALLVACGDDNGLLSSSHAGSLQDALVAVQSACAEGQTARAEVVAQRFADRVVALPPGEVDRRLIENLQDGAETLETVVARSCTATTGTPTQPTVTTTTTPTTTAPATTTTVPTTTEPTTPAEPPPATTPPATTTPDPGGGTPGDGDDDGSGDGSGNPGGAPPGLAKKGLGAP